jgi:hypothetical protein
MGAHESRKPPRYPVALEYEDNEYIYISSAYGYSELKKDIEKIGDRPFKIILTECRTL